MAKQVLVHRFLVKCQCGHEDMMEIPLARKRDELAMRYYASRRPCPKCNQKEGTPK